VKGKGTPAWRLPCGSIHLGLSVECARTTVTSIGINIGPRAEPFPIDLVDDDDSDNDGEVGRGS
jgi:hypothetical protein